MRPAAVAIMKRPLNRVLGEAMKQHNWKLTASDEDQEDGPPIGWPERQSGAARGGERFSADSPQPLCCQAVARSRKWFGSWRRSSPDLWHVRHLEYAGAVSIEETAPTWGIEAVIRAVRRGVRESREAAK